MEAYKDTNTVTETTPTTTQTPTGLQAYKDIGQRYAEQQARLNENYDAQVSDLDYSKMTRQQQADITKSQLQKYLPYYYKSKGLSGLGLEQSAMLEANANYTNQLGQIEADYRQDKIALDNYRDEKLTEAENYYLDKLDEQKASDSKSAYDEVAYVLEGYKEDEKLTDDEIKEAEAILDIYIDSMTPSDQVAIKNLLANYKTRFAEEKKNNDNNVPALDDDYEITEEMRKGSQYIEIGNKKYVAYTINPIFGTHYSKGWFNGKAREKGYASGTDPDIPNGLLINDEKNKGYFMFYNGEWIPVKEIKKTN